MTHPQCLRSAAGLALAVIITAAQGCGGGQSAGGLSEDERLDPAHLMPLAEGNVWTYDAYREGTEGVTLAAIRVVRAEGNHYQIAAMFADAEEDYEVRPEGIYLTDSGAWLLRSPIEVGAEWPTRGGRTARVASTEESASTPRGDFSGCVRIEERGGRLGAEVSTVYCADIGMVSTRSSLTAETTGRTLVEGGNLREYSLNTDAQAAE